MSRSREIRRYAKMVDVALTYLCLHWVVDPRKSCKHPLKQMMTTVLLGFVSGCKNLRELEKLTEKLSPPVRRLLGIRGRVADTTLRDLLMKYAGDVRPLRRLLHRQVQAAHRKKQLDPDELPCGVLAVDGKYATTKLPDEVYAQHQGDGNWRVGMLGAVLSSAAAPVCVDAKPIAHSTSESSAFPGLIRAIVDVHGGTNLFEVVTADAGIGDRPNADLLNNDFELGYVFAIKGDQPTLYDELDRLLGRRPVPEASASTEDRIDNQTVLIRRIWCTTEIAGYHWNHIRMGLRVQAEKRRNDGTLLSVENRFFVTNVPPRRFSPEHWLRVVRWHWRVELFHQVLDVAFEEDERPWIEDAGGMAVVQLLRRVAYNILLLYRNVSRRGEKKGAIPWKDLFESVHFAVTAATEQHLANLRPRSKGLPPPTPPP